MIKNVYIHIPFCKGGKWGKCYYCSFTSYTDLSLKNNYIHALIKQIKSEYKGEKLNTLYFGGGTPSLLDVEDFKSLIELFNFENNAEITVEINPDSVDLQYLKALKHLGINRLSIGAQTFNDEVLKFIGRKHNAEQIKLALNYAQKAGFDNISLDLIYGLGMNVFEDDLKQVIELNPRHISLYGLKIEKGCYFYNNPPLYSFPDEDAQANMYLNAVEVLKNNKFEHYEVSNFSKSGFESKHNLNYWNNNTYYGFGCSASGYMDKTRYQMQSDLGKYIKNPFKRDFEKELTEQEILEETIFLGLRKIAGINISEINKKFRIDFEQDYAETLEKYSDYFIKTNYGYALSTKGILISNVILSEFV